MEPSVQKSGAYTIRRATAADAGAVARVHVDTWRTTYRGIVPGSFLEAMTYAESESRWRQGLERDIPRYAMFVAEGSDGIVGFANGGPLRQEIPGYNGELYAIYVLQAYQRHGLGRRLVERVAQHLAESGLGSMVIWVLADNHSARRFYEAIGGRLVGEQDIEIGGRRLREVAYGWPTLATLVGSG